MKDRKFTPRGPRGGSKPFNRPGKSAGRPARRERDSHPDGPVILYGWHTVTMALANPARQIRKLTLTVTGTVASIAADGVGVDLTAIDDEGTSIATGMAVVCLHDRI